MEYFIGFFVAIVALIVVVKFTGTYREDKRMPVLYSQTRTFFMLKEILGIDIIIDEVKMTQSKVWERDNTLRVFFLEDRAYWIKNNALFVGDIINGIVDHENAIQVDTMAMDNVELKKTMFIVEKLREGLGDDNWSPGYKGF